MHNKFETLARAGYAARGVVYLLLGGLALASIVWGRARPDGSTDALSSLLQLPFGQLVLGLVAIGLVGHILWRLAQGLLNADGVKDNLQGWIGRAGSVVSGLTNLALAFAAGNLALGHGQGDGGSGEESASTWLIGQPFGVWLLGLVGLGVVAAGAVQIWRALSHHYRDRISLPPAHKRWLDPLCQFGVSARGALFIIIGGFLVYAALTVSPAQAGGLADALDYVYELPFGPWLYGLAALGLLAFGAYGIVEGLYRRIDAPDGLDLRAAISH